MAIQLSRSKNSSPSVSNAHYGEFVAGTIYNVKLTSQLDNNDPPSFMAQCDADEVRGFVNTFEDTVRKCADHKVDLIKSLQDDMASGKLVEVECYKAGRCRVVIELTD